VNDAEAGEDEDRTEHVGQPTVLQDQRPEAFHRPVRRHRRRHGLRPPRHGRHRHERPADHGHRHPADAADRIELVHRPRHGGHQHAEGAQRQGQDDDEQHDTGDGARDREAEERAAEKEEHPELDDADSDRGQDLAHHQVGRGRRRGP